MLYPKIKTKKEKINIIDQIKSLKETFISLFSSFYNYKTFIIFIEKKLHF